MPSTRYKYTSVSKAGSSPSASTRKSENDATGDPGRSALSPGSPISSSGRQGQSSSRGAGADPRKGFSRLQRWCGASPRKGVGAAVIDRKRIGEQGRGRPASPPRPFIFPQYEAAPLPTASPPSDMWARYVPGLTRHASRASEKGGPPPRRRLRPPVFFADVGEGTPRRCREMTEWRDKCIKRNTFYGLRVILQPDKLFRLTTLPAHFDNQWRMQAGEGGGVSKTAAKTLT